MGLYLCIFDEEDEIDGVQVGHYSDFNAMREYVTREFEGGVLGRKFPTLILHSDCDGEWSVQDCEKLSVELTDLIVLMKQKPPIPFSGNWQNIVAKSIGLVPNNAHESLIDVDGEFVLDRMLGLSTLSIERGLPILFQ